MAQDRPTAAELLAAIADLLREEVTPVLDKADPRLGFQMRVAANSLAILEREARLGPGADAREHRAAGDAAGPRRQPRRSQPRAGPPAAQRRTRRARRRT